MGLDTHSAGMLGPLPQKARGRPERRGRLWRELTDPWISQCAWGGLLEISTFFFSSSHHSCDDQLAPHQELQAVHSRWGAPSL